MSALVIPLATHPAYVLARPSLVDRIASTVSDNVYPLDVPGRVYWHENGRIMKAGEPPQIMFHADVSHRVSWYCDMIDIAHETSDDTKFDNMCELLAQLGDAIRDAHRWRRMHGVSA